jgi:hypothetical protein
LRSPSMRGIAEACGVDVIDVVYPQNCDMRATAADNPLWNRGK